MQHLVDDLLTLAAGGKLAQNANTVQTVPDGANVMEPKLDGWRILAHIGSDTVTYFTRSGNSYPAKQLPRVTEELLASFPADTWLDGEAVALRIEGGRVVNEWSTAQSVMTKVGGHAAADQVSLMVFDLIAHAGIDARPLPFAKRRSLLELAFEKAGEMRSVTLVPQTEATDANAKAYVAQGFEGAMVKAINARYASGARGRGWSKIKPQTTVEAVVMGFKEGQNGFTGMIGAIVFGQYDENGELIERGRCSGMDIATRKDISAHRDEWVGRVIEVAHHGVIKDKLRHPQFKRVREDKKPEQVLLHNG